MGSAFSSIKTTLSGIGVLICSGTSYAGILPEKFNSLLLLICGVLVAFGLIAAKDANKSNALHPTETPNTVG